MPLSEAAAKVIARIEAKILDKINDMKTNGGSYLQQVKTVTVAGQPVAVKQGGVGGALDKLGSALDAVTQAVQLAGDIANLVQNPMSLVEGAVGGAISDVTSKVSALDVAGKLTGGQLSTLTASINNVTSKLNDFQAHTANLSGLSSSITDSVPDFKKITSLGDSIQKLGNVTVKDFINDSASALKSQTLLETIKDKMNIPIQNGMDKILTLDPVTDASEISSILSNINTELNSYATSIDDVVVSDTTNFNNYNDNLTASQDVLNFATDYKDPDTASHAILVNLGVAKESTMETLDSAFATAEQQLAQEQQATS